LKKIEEILDSNIAGDPTSSCRWTRISTYSLKKKLKDEGVDISSSSVGKILKHGKFSLLKNRKTIAETKHPDRNEQFEIIAAVKKEFEIKGQPVICVDSKKKELIGNFRNPGGRWSKNADEVLTHDFRSQSDGIANPYGIYEPVHNVGTVIVGTSKDTPEFAVDAIGIWLSKYATERYNNLKELLILCDSGGSNGYRPRLWKYSLYHKISKPYNVKIKVCHYPTGASKWNMVDHRLFSFITLNWQGIPLRSYETVLNCIKSTSTKKGLKVDAELNVKQYEKGIKIDDKQMQNINLVKQEKLTNWNYVIAP
jgi:hypothetical protein